MSKINSTASGFTVIKSLLSPKGHNGEIMLQDATGNKIGETKNKCAILEQFYESLYARRDLKCSQPIYHISEYKHVPNLMLSSLWVGMYVCASVPDSVLCLPPYTSIALPIQEREKPGSSGFSILCRPSHCRGGWRFQSN